MHATHTGAAVFSELAALPLAAYTTRVENAVLSQYGEELEEVWNKGKKSPGRVLLFEARLILALTLTLTLTLINPNSPLNPTHSPPFGQSALAELSSSAERQELGLSASADRVSRNEFCLVMLLRMGKVCYWPHRRPSTR